MDNVWIVSLLMMSAIAYLGWGIAKYIVTDKWPSFTIPKEQKYFMDGKIPCRFIAKDGYRVICVDMFGQSRFVSDKIVYITKSEYDVECRRYLSEEAIESRRLSLESKILVKIKDLDAKVASLELDRKIRDMKERNNENI